MKVTLIVGMTVIHPAMPQGQPHPRGMLAAHRAAPEFFPLNAKTHPTT